MALAEPGRAAQATVEPPALSTSVIVAGRFAAVIYDHFVRAADAP